VVVLLRVAALAGERVGLNRVGTPSKPTAGAALAYATAAAWLWMMVLVVGPVRWEPSAVAPALLYAVSFGLYAWALALGPLSVVAPWPAATALMLWIAHPEGGWVAFAGVGALVAGAVLTAGQQPRRHVGPILVMLVSDAVLAMARGWDAVRAAGPILPYAATVYTVVAVLLVAAASLTASGPAAWAVARQRPWSVALAGVSNGVAYLTVLALLVHWPPYLVEALSAVAGVVASAAGMVWLGEERSVSRMAGAVAVGVGAALLVRARMAGS
jgi:hypothetical protein